MRKLLTPVSIMIPRVQFERIQPQSSSPLLICIEMRVVPKPKSSASVTAMEPTWLSLVTTTAISIATILGTGILGLPVSLHKAGIWPFLFNFTISMFAQVGVVVAMTELLQRAYAMSSKSVLAATEPFSLEHEYHSLGGENDDFHSSDQPFLDGAESADFESPSLHTMSKLFLNHWSLQYLFEGFVLLHFVSIMSSYALAAPQAFRQLVPAFAALSARTATGIFAICASLLVIFLVPLLLPLLTFATFAKGGLLSILVIITIWVGFEIQESSTSTWGLATVEPFLMGIIALSGVVNLMPVTFQACLASCGTHRPTTVSKSFIVSYRRATVLGVVLCYLLNVGWCIAVLMCVPQTSSAVHSTSLTEAHAAGEISTVPLIEVLEARGGNLNDVIAFMIDLFIAVSLTISFFVMGIGMKHALDGQLKALVPEYSSSFRRISTRSLYYLAWFGAVFLIAFFNPHSFIALLAGITSLCLNVEGGVFIMYMLVQSRRQIRNQIVLGSALSDKASALLVVSVGAYFSLAVLIDLVFYLPYAFQGR